MATKVAKTTKLPRVSVGLLVKVEQGDGWFRVYAFPVALGRDGASMPLDGLVNGFDPADLRVCCQGDAERRRDEAGAPRVFAWRVEYHAPCSVDRDRAEGMAKTLALIERRLKALRERFGPATTYGQYVARVADALGAEAMLHRSRFDEDDRRFAVGDGAELIDYLIEKWAGSDPRKENVA